MFSRCLYHIQHLHSGIMLIPGSPKTLTWKPPPTLAPHIKRKIPKMSPKWVMGDSPKVPKNLSTLSKC